MCSVIGVGLQEAREKLHHRVEAGDDIGIVLVIIVREPLAGDIPVIVLEQVLDDVIGGLLVGVKRRILVGEHRVGCGATVTPTTGSCANAAEQAADSMTTASKLRRVFMRA